MIVPIQGLLNPPNRLGAVGQELYGLVIVYSIGTIVHPDAGYAKVD